MQRTRPGAHPFPKRLMMTTVALDTRNPATSWAEARRLADRRAAELIDEPLLLAWYDRDEDFESPAHTSECHDRCDVPGYIEYAESRGATIRIDVDGGRFVFCYRPLGEFGAALEKG